VKGSTSLTDAKQNEVGRGSYTEGRDEAWRQTLERGRVNDGASQSYCNSRTI